MSVVAPAGSQAVFLCSVVSNPLATVYWTYGSSRQNLTNSGRIFLNSTALVISGVEASDEGYYHCIAQNSFGVNSTSGSLTIGGEIDDPIFMLWLRYISRCTCEKCFLK